jgi:hypothetical protein
MPTLFLFHFDDYIQPTTERHDFRMTKMFERAQRSTAGIRAVTTVK